MTEKKGALVEFRLNASGALTEKIDGLLQMHAFHDSLGLKPEDFKEYGRLADGKFVPYWKADEQFDDFVQREAGINRAPEEVTLETVQRFFTKSEFPMSKDNEESLLDLGDLFTASEIDQLQSYAIMIGSEEWHELALAFEAAGMIPKGDVIKVESPLIGLREQANDELLEFNAEVRNEADAVYGSPEYFPEPEEEPSVVLRYKEMDIFPQEPQLTYIRKWGHKVYSSIVQGEAKSYGSRTPIWGMEATVNLVVMGEEKNRKLTSSLIEKRALLKYILASYVLEIQREKMNDLKYIFTIVDARKSMDADPKEKWGFETPARKPTTP